MTDSKPQVRFATLGSIRSAQPEWDAYNVVRDGHRPMPSMYPATRRPNWWGSGTTPEDLSRLAKQSGIPVSWVTPGRVLSLLMNCEDHDARLAVLVAHQDSVRDLCGQVAAECTDEWLGDTPEIVTKVMAAWGDGHVQAAACLALLAVEELAYDVVLD
ncbi:hypothetical protein [Actinacidiphila oryziradicis]|uniref:Uncharacterized protein n=1 Tax=Actinacidiphila oryziradicis TaxID=2571141 RepID=A0A4U0S9K3_9ACTN|nr:hypothetical protein [Actinacidiphila oryziradicis]TKA04907.1 hypothetical protein FCI23_34075 [Actinacidiphila oryziradicis]